MKLQRLARATSVITCLFLCTTPLMAQTFTWQQNAGGAYNWYSSNQWSTNPFVGGTGVTANLTANLTGTSTITLDSPVTLNALNIGNATSAFGYTLTGANGLTFDGTTPGLVMTAGAANQSVNVPIVLNAATTFTNNSTVGTLTVGSGGVTAGTNAIAFAGAGNTTFNAIVTGTTGAITKTGAGTVTFAAPAAFGTLTSSTAYGTISTGDITVNAGQMAVQNINLRSVNTNANRGAGVRGLTIASGAVFTVNGTLNIEPDSNVYVTQISGLGTLQLRNGTSTLAAPSFANDYGPSGGDADPWGTVIAATVDVGPGTHWFVGKTNRNDVSRYAGDTRFDAPITGSGNIQVRGTNSNGAREWHLVFNANNSGFTGGVSIANADLNLANNNALSAANPVTFNTVVDAATISQSILFLWGHNVSIGSLNDTSAATTNNFIRNGSLSGVANGGTNSNANGATFGVALGLDLDSTLTINQTTAGAFNGVIADGLNDNDPGAAGPYRTISIVKNGPGTLTLTGNNTYAGTTTVNAGTLLVNGQTGANSGVGTGAVTVNTGGTFGGTGQTTGAVTVNIGGTVRGGSSRTVGTLTIGGNLNIMGGTAVQGAARSRITVNSTTASLIQVNGQVNITTAGAPLVIDIENASLNPIVQGTAYTRTVTSAVGGYFVNGVGPTANNTSFTLGTDFIVTSSDFAGFSNVALQIQGANLVLTFTPVPEPTTVLGFATASMFAAGWVRRRVRRQATSV